MLPDLEIARLKQAADFTLLPRAHGAPPVTGVLRSEPGDFRVSETLPFELTGDGEHLYLRVRKTGQNTRWVAKRLADAAGLPYRAVGIAGLKDRHAITEQWFSLHLPGKPDPDEFDIPGVEILESVRHGGKLRTGAVASNQFVLTIRDLRGDWQTLEEHVEAVRSHGAPNYFGPQRFGHDAANLLLMNSEGRVGREARSFGLSALRSALFNGYLAARIVDGSWLQLLPGEIAARGDSERPAGLLWGEGQNHAADAALALEEAWYGLFPETRLLLEQAKVRMMRRALAVLPDNLQMTRQDDRCLVSFALPRGAYATSVLRELGEFSDHGPDEGAED